VTWRGGGGGRRGGVEREGVEKRANGIVSEREEVGWEGPFFVVT